MANSNPIVPSVLCTERLQKARDVLRQQMQKSVGETNLQMNIYFSDADLVEYILGEWLRLQEPAPRLSYDEVVARLEEARRYFDMAPGTRGSERKVSCTLPDGKKTVAVLRSHGAADFNDCTDPAVGPLQHVGGQMLPGKGPGGAGS